MSFIDSMISALSPKWSLQRKYWRSLENSYKGGVPTRTSEGWGAASGFRFGSLQERVDQLGGRDRAYQAYRNNPVAKTLVDTETDNVIGDGLNYQPQSSSEEWNREAKDRYYEWLKVCSVRGPDIIAGCEVERQLWALSRVAGDIGWILVSRGNDSRIQVVQAENIVTPDGMYADDAVYDGIRFDAFGQPTTYYVLGHSERAARREFVPIPARDFVYLPHMTDSNQARGVSCYITIFDLLSHLDRYIDGVSLAAWMATVFGIIFKEENAAKQLHTLSATLPDSQGVDRKALTMENGMVKFMGTSGEAVQVDAKQPMQHTPQFVQMMLRMLGQPFDMPLEVVAKDMSTVNFASARIGLLGFYRACRIKAARFSYRWSRTIGWWLSRERLRASDDRNKWRTAFPADFLKHELLINAWDYTDPVSEAQSDQLQIDMGTKTHQMVISERGRDAEQILRERKEWAEKTADMPQVRSTMTRDAAAEAGADPNAPDPELERIKAEADAYGVAVRAGVITPQTDDEDAFREKLALPAMSDDAKAAWKKDEGVRRPITLTPPPGTEPAPVGGRITEPEEQESDNGNGNGNS